MSDQRPPENPYGQPTPAENPSGQPPAAENPYGQTTPAENPSGQPPAAENPYGEPAGYGQPVPPPNPYGAPVTGENPYGPSGAVPGAAHPLYPGYPSRSAARPGTVTAAGWITIVLSGLSALLYGFVALMLLVARDAVVDEIARQPEMRDLDVDPDSIVGALVAMMIVLVVWALAAVVAGVFVLRRSNVARILLVISSVLVALGSLLSIMSGVSAVWLIASVAVIILLFVGGAGDWFARRSGAGPTGMGNFGG